MSISKYSVDLTMSGNSTEATLYRFSNEEEYVSVKDNVDKSEVVMNMKEFDRLVDFVKKNRNHENTSCYHAL